MVSVERPSEMGAPQWNGLLQRELRFVLDPVEVDEYHEKGFLILRDVFDLRRLKSIVKSPNGLSITRFR
jgi:hypothetical protein